MSPNDKENGNFPEQHQEKQPGERSEMTPKPETENPASLSEEKTAHHGESAPMKRAGQPYEVATCFLFLAGEDSSYINGQVLHPNGGIVVNG
ncbi:MAG: SDR family oxidoreductase [Desulfobacterales bacterium]